ncbi:hypothetical protein BDQ17DRAFT_1337423 [Cyathus striatus]|nr:hypothetical protein BDQ17DRAFT_1337423 [Cyathus striatus]
MARTTDRQKYEKALIEAFIVNTIAKEEMKHSSDSSDSNSTTSSSCSDSDDSDESMSADDSINPSNCINTFIDRLLVTVLRNTGSVAKLDFMLDGRGNKLTRYADNAPTESGYNKYNSTLYYLQQPKNYKPPWRNGSASLSYLSKAELERRKLWVRSPSAPMEKKWYNDREI